MKSADTDRAAERRGHYSANSGVFPLVKQGVPDWDDLSGGRNGERAMRLVIAGGTGFLGSPLAETYAEDGHDVRVLSRGLVSGDSRHDPGTGVPGVTRVGWVPDGKTGPWASVLEGASAVINLTGESIDGGRWTAERKARIRDSRVLATRSLATAITAASTPPPVFISGSAVGYYGPHGDEPLTEAAPPGHDFLAEVCREWEEEAQRATRPGTRVVTLRTGIVLERLAARSNG